ncbi:class I SAM-dependent methyltransferase [Hymenobacter cellulosilyticus]|uniref:Class I SAM-dependent methyltransferase n=1 Tax=Hymenobacter cellulosilyticus TaxID=2932248 RepID=A0A8T9Q6T6_9BACT|nr:class I SAM-dependent methyltransferase [Hymenobacter cellulosilyticus]UOQ72662.1 class I SAM-dependent methyltransferase [Hymenobacter cellulosilyticus]
MSKISKTLRGLAALARNPWLLNHVLAADEASWQGRAQAHSGRQLTKLGLPMVPLHTFLSAADTTVQPFAFREGGSLPTDLLLLRALCRRVAQATYFEIGTWRGESAANVADVAQAVYTLNLSAEELRQLGLPERYIELHGFFSRPRPNVTHLHGNSATFDMAGLGRKFDVVFIDGDHTYEAVRTDTRRVFEHLVGPQTVVVWHDASRQPGQPRWEVLAGILDGLPATAMGQLVQVENTLCALYSPQLLPAHTPDPLAAPQHWFSVNLTQLGA